MIEMTLAEVATVTGGRLHRVPGPPPAGAADPSGEPAEAAAATVTSVEFDSRAVGPGALFLALPGARADGHDFAAAAVARGATGVLAGREVDAPAVVVPPIERRDSHTYLGAVDPDGRGAAVLAGLGRLARHVLGALPGLAVVGVTGSAGKTSTKDLLAAVLSPLGRTVAPPESFNNELGTPWTALRADASTRHLVLEFSARGAGHIADLCAVAPPRIGVVLNVGSAHLGEFGSRAGIAAAKGELVEALPPGDLPSYPSGPSRGGVAVLNADDELVLAMRSRTPARVVTFGRSADADVRACDETLVAGRATFRLVTPAGSAPVTLRLVGAHQVPNALAAAAVALELGGTPEQIARALSAAEPASRWRMEVTDRADGVTVVNDAYNANPEAMRAALSALVSVAGPQRRTWAVLGPMGEIGADADAAHAELVDVADAAGVGRVVAVGSPGYGPGAEHVDDVAAALELLRGALEPGDVVLVKASRAAGLERVAAGLLGSATEGLARR
ncbi:UDP-N-acetylmuramoyl-tripeptide--D-alanyl-D-alanine ligase [Pseudonocardia sp. HH130630-07]|uniref:UDP-N-acetylmuramoyl-tripeptide--D-alanyl-D- alanine ligase n=1 Tax=Pseudonocardia sp. HH130630-07 TaxID=1690815 RepID=UPI000814ED77|nr:UDP-N-acetylmuramoyl-tripeptide--D-alanyl-D-alanine ligase [Pseudonocardia sp. HH130630-07]ANY05093.1 UDP-N-acetylmuramoyl-tripeptide--D-alanyl-D-alanine ligase [Pseudonocardia sp. HH130630-07]